MAVSIAPMSPFDLEGGEDFVEYAERFEMYLQASKVTEGNMKRATFLSQLGASGYKLLRSLRGNNPSNKSYEDLVKLLREHLKPKPNVIAQRFRFYKRDRKQGESVSEYVAELRKLSEYCEFGEKVEEYTLETDLFVD